MRVGYTGWTWLINHEDNHKWEFEQFLKEVSDLGYEVVENFAFITKYFDNDADEVKALWTSTTGDGQPLSPLFRGSRSRLR